MSPTPDPRHPDLPVDPAELREILGRAVRRLCPSSLASQRDDLVQDACLRILKLRRGSEESAPLQASYLWRVAHSVVMDEIRRRRRRPESPLESPGLSRDGSPAADPEGSRSAAELGSAIQEGLGRLRPARRWAVLLYLQGFSLRDSARILGWTSKRVDNQRYQGLAELRKDLRGRGWSP